MTVRRTLTVVAVSALVAVPTASAVDGAPLPSRDGVVVAWQARTSTAIVVTGDQRVYSVHTLRRVAPGSRVRVNGIKWGTPTSGIKWSVAPSGIKWGIAKAANGTYTSSLTKLPGRATTMALRGTVARRFGTRGVAVSIPGSTVVIPLRGAVWLPGGKRSNEVVALGSPGAKVTVRVNFDAKGRASSNRVVETAPPAVRPTLPISGRVTAVDLTARTLTIQAGTVAFPLVMTIFLPPTADITKYPVGSEIAATVTQATAPDTTIAATALSLNRTFADADSPVTSIAVPAPNPAHMAAIETMQTEWAAARAGGLIPNTGVFTSEVNRLDRIEFLILTGDKPKAIAELDQFEKKIDGRPADIIDMVFRDKALAASVALRAQLLAG
jgi:hypothetical protein